MKQKKKVSKIRKVKIGKNITIIESANLYQFKIEDNCFVGHGVNFVNEKF